MKAKRTAACMLSVLLLAQLAPVLAAADTDFWEQPRYSDYTKEHAGAPQPTGNLLITADSATSHDNVTILGSYEGKSGPLLRTEDTGFVECTFTVPADASYQMEFSYYPVEGKGQKIERRLTIDGEAPFQEAATVVLDRIYRDEESNKMDAAGNQIPSSQTEVRRWNTQMVRDESGIEDAPLRFFLTAGVHTIRLESVKEPLVIEHIRLCGSKDIPSYQSYINTFSQADYVGGNEPIKFQAETPDEKSDSSMYATSDRSTSATEPYAGEKTRLNMLSGGKFSSPNQWVTYRFNVKKAGLYRLSLKVKQGYKDGGFTARQILINDAIPFEEAACRIFTYTNRWKSDVLGDGNRDYWFYLKEGSNTLTLKAVVGGMSGILSDTQRLVSALNDVYRAIFMITGPDPDLYRDYGFKKALPDEIAVLRDSVDTLDDLMNRIMDVTGETGSYLAPFQKLRLDADEMVKDAESIGKRMQGFKTNLGALTDWVTTEQSQPLDMDYIEFLPKDAQPQKAAAGFFADLWHQVRLFISSFCTSYSMADSDAQVNESITAWVITGGLDQAQLVKQLVDERFAAQTGIGVKVQLVPTALLPSTLAGTGPDIALFVANSEPINYAVRGASKDLTAFPNFSEVTSRFEAEALVPYTFMERTYALPETQSWPMLFYRKDILKELSVSLPATWDEVCDTIIRLQEKNLAFAMPVDITGYYMFLNQRGGRLFKDNGAAVDLDAPQALAAFSQWTDFFSSYKLDVEYNFVNRFRSGEMPMGIADFTTSNQLRVFAPEIRGMWGMTTIPATLRADGTKDNSAICNGTANMILEQAKNPQAAWTFLNWWSSDETQSAYARQLESLLGSAARYATANKQAFFKQAWNAEEMTALTAQRTSAKAIPEVPGSYIVPRYVDFAFKAVVNDSADPGKEILNYTKIINAELTRKRKEFADILNP